MKKKLKKCRKFASSVVAATMVMSTINAPLAIYASDNSAQESAEKIEFKTAGEDSIYKGLPLFDGIPAHLDAYLDVLMDYIGTEGMVRTALATVAITSCALANMPEISFQVQNYSAIMCKVFLQISRQSLHSVRPGTKELVKKVGKVIGTENLNTCDFLDTISNFNAVTCTAMQDLRVNPLSGRYDEGFGEDGTLVSEMVDAMATGASGIEEEENEDGFWTKCIVTTKHYTDYAGQQFRRSANIANSLRSVMEQQAKNIKKGISDGSVSGFMTSYGRTAGIPNSLSPLVQWIQSFAPFGEDGGNYVVTDYSSDWQLYSENSMGNGYDNSYVPTYSDALSLMLMARTGQGAANDQSTLEEPNTENQDAVMAELENGTSGLSLGDIKKTARHR